MPTLSLLCIVWRITNIIYISDHFLWHIFRYCINIVPQEIPEQWYCEDCIAHEQASNDPKGNSPLDKPRLERAQLEFVPLTKARAPPQTGKVKFISEREITLLNDRKYFAKRSLGRFLVA